MKSLLFISLILIINACLFFSCKDKPTEPENTPPRIKEIITSPVNSYSNRLEYDKSIQITAICVDDEGDQIEYNWSSESGVFLEGSSTRTVKWKPPVTEKEEEYEINLLASDSKLTDEKSTFIYVQAPLPGFALSSNSLNFGEKYENLILTIFNLGNAELKWNTNGVDNWYKLNKTSGEIAPKSKDSIMISIDRENLNVGEYNNKFSIKYKLDTWQEAEIDISCNIVSSYNVTGYTYYSGTRIPVSGVKISILEKTSTTGTDGFYEIKNLIKGTYTITCLKEGYDDFSEQIEIINENINHDIEMTSANYTFKLFGNVISDYDNNPLENVLVAILNPDNNFSNLQTYTDINGYYQIPTVPQGSRTVLFIKENYDTLKTQLFIANSDYNYNTHLNPKQVNLGGTIDEKIVLKEFNSPYYVIDNFKAPEVEIEAGVNIIFKGPFRFNSKIISRGNISQKIKFTSEYDYYNWGTIVAQKNSILEYIEFKDLDTALTSNYYGENFKDVKNCNFYNNNFDLNIYSQKSYDRNPVNIENCVFDKRNNNNGSMKIRDSSLKLKDCTFSTDSYENKAIAIQYELFYDNSVSIENIAVDNFDIGFDYYAPSHSQSDNVDIKIMKSKFKTCGRGVLIDHSAPDQKVEINVSDCIFENNISGYVQYSVSGNRDLTLTNIEYSDFSACKTALYLAEIRSPKINKCNIFNNERGIVCVYNHLVRVSECNLNNNEIYDIEKELYNEVIANNNYWGGGKPSLDRFKYTNNLIIDEWYDEKIEDAGPRY